MTWTWRFLIRALVIQENRIGRCRDTREVKKERGNTRRGKEGLMLGKEGVSTGSQVSAVGLQMFAQGKRTNLRKGTQCLTSYTLTIWFTFITGALSKELLTPIWVLKSKIGRGRGSPSSKIRARN